MRLYSAPRATLTVWLPVLFVILPGCGDRAPSSAVTEPDEGRLVVIGGGLSSENELVYRQVLEGREGEGPICVLPTAGASPESSMESAVERIERWGGEGSALGIPISTENPERALDPDVAGELRGCGGFYFTGGVQSRILDVFRPDGQSTPAYDALMDRFRQGAVIAGSSAGAAMMSDPMIAGGSSEAAFTDGVRGEGVRLAEGMGFLPDLLVDQHFLARGRVGRLIVALLEEPRISLGAGVDENTALVVHGDRAWVAGRSGVVLVDATGTTREGGSPAEARGLRLELLGPGDTVDLGTLAVRAGEGKVPVAEMIAGEGVDFIPDVPEAPAEGLFERWMFLHLLHHLAAAEQRSVTLTVAEHEVTVGTAQGHRGVAYPQAGVRGTPFGLSVGPLDVEIRRAGDGR